LREAQLILNLIAAFPPRRLNSRYSISVELSIRNKSQDWNTKSAASGFAGFTEFQIAKLHCAVEAVGASIHRNFDTRRRLRVQSPHSGRLTVAAYHGKLRGAVNIGATNGTDDMFAALVSGSTVGKTLGGEVT
jgi:hypothetical protein